jgi:translation initiation factor 4G
LKSLKFCPKENCLVYINFFKKNHLLKLTKKKTGNIRFIGELFKLGMLGTNIMHFCIKKLLDGDINNPIEEDIEQLCKLLENVGLKLDVESAKRWMDDYFERLKKISKNLSNRYRFMVEDLIDLRNNKWVSIIPTNTPTNQK